MILAHRSGSTRLSGDYGTHDIAELTGRDQALATKELMNKACRKRIATAERVDQINWLSWRPASYCVVDHTQGNLNIRLSAEPIDHKVGFFEILVPSIAIGRDDAEHTSSPDNFSTVKLTASSFEVEHTASYQAIPAQPNSLIFSTTAFLTSSN